VATAVFADSRVREHLWDRAGHPERSERYDAVMSALERDGLLPRLLPLETRDATRQELLLCHTAEYLELAKTDAVSGRPCLSTGDTDLSPNSFDIAVCAAGGVLNAVDAVFAGTARNAFCVVRPPGHHANAGRGMGFCILNNIALAARYAQQRYGAERVLIADWDVHHGNGTQDIFYRDGSVFFFSTHQWPLYPGTGRRDETGMDSGRGTTMNFPLPAGSGRTEVLGAVMNSLAPAMDSFRPDLVLVSAGFDSRAGDPLGRFTLTDQDFTDLTRLLMEMADRYAGGRLVSALEGGYNLEGLGSAAAAHVAALLNH
jgi:acetoin utilization deacetylase AcuC-like enzyme